MLQLKDKNRKDERIQEVRSGIITGKYLQIPAGLHITKPISFSTCPVSNPGPPALVASTLTTEPPNPQWGQTVWKEFRVAVKQQFEYGLEIKVPNNLSPYTGRFSF